MGEVGRFRPLGLELLIYDCCVENDYSPDGPLGMVGGT